MPSRQTTLFSHFDSVDEAPGPSRPRRAAAARAPLFQEKSDSESEGSDGLANIKLSPQKPSTQKPKRMVVEVPMTQQRSLRRTVYDSEDDEEEEEEEIEVIEKPARRRYSPNKSKTVNSSQSRKLREDEGETTDEDADEISIPLKISGRDRTPPDYDEKRKRKLDSARDARRKLDDERKQRADDDKIDEDITTFPSPKSNKGGKRKRSLSIVPIPSAELLAARRNNQSNDDIIAIPTPPATATSRPELAPSANASQAKAPSRPRPLAFRRTPSLVEVEIRSMSPVDLAKYKVWTLEDFKSVPTIQSKPKDTNRLQSSTPRLDPIAETTAPKNDVNVELSDDDLDVLTEHEEFVAAKQPEPKRTAPKSSSSFAVVVPTRTYKGKEKQKRIPIGSSDSEESESLVVKPRARKVLQEKPSAKKRGHEHKKQGKLKSKTKVRDPDAGGAETEDEDDVLEDLKMDEPERFKSKTRLRKKKETAFQRKIRKLKNQRLGIAESSSEASSSEASGKTYTSDSAPHSIVSSDSENFIVEDDGQQEQVRLPHMFSLDSAQTPEFKFKVVFHYLVLLVMKGPSILPLTGEEAEYFQPQLLDLRRRMEGYNNFRVRSQVWRGNFVAALQKYPEFEVEELNDPEQGCDACHMGGRLSKFRVTLNGYPYDRDTHEPLDTSEEESESSGSNSGSNPKSSKLPRSMLMARSEVFHDISHWEDRLFYSIRRHYRDMLRAKYKPVPSDSEKSTTDDDPDSDPDEARERRRNREKKRAATQARVTKLRKKTLPDNYKDVDQVTDWMDRMDFQSREFKRIEELIERSARLEHDRSTDD
ncbi:hypothetical protein CI109_106970 [Kwoniella shandongensis]|uniref:DUF4211 domain-containing protein n=1 Tax=Kwoniella shandongensis TaxID=1734106 RepID=A0AAJ8LR11_9TREE